MRSVLAALALASLSSPALAHVTLEVPASRTTLQKDGPCGAAASDPLHVRGTAVHAYAPGATLTVEWSETVDHPGHYRIAFDDDGQDFENPVTGSEQFANVLVDDITDHAGGAYSQQITLPDLECDNCTLQLIQVMKDAPPYAEGDLYYQCADLVLTSAPLPDAGPGGAGADAGGGGTGTDGGVSGETGITGGDVDATGGCSAGGPGETGTLAGLLAIVGRLGLAQVRRRRTA